MQIVLEAIGADDLPRCKKLVFEDKETGDKVEFINATLLESILTQEDLKKIREVK